MAVHALAACSLVTCQPRSLSGCTTGILSNTYIFLDIQLTDITPTIVWSEGALDRYVQEERVRPLPLGKCMASHVQLHIKAERRRRCNAP